MEMIWWGKTQQELLGQMLQWCEEIISEIETLNLGLDLDVVQAKIIHDTETRLDQSKSLRQDNTSLVETMAATIR